MGLTNLKPTYKVVANKKDVTAAINERLLSLHVTDEAGQQSDTVELTFDDVPKLTAGKTMPHIELPATGAILEIFMGFDGKNVRMGSYFVDEVDVSGPPDQIVVRGKAAPYQTKETTRLQSHKTRSWANGTKLGDMVKKIAADHGLVPVISADLAGLALPHYSQTDESDIHLLTRIARQYGATVKPAEGKLVVVKTAAGKTASGKNIPIQTIKKTEVTTYHMGTAKRDEAGSVTAKYHDPASGQTVKVTVGSGDPKQTIRHIQPNRDSALAAAQARLNRKKRGSKTLSLTFPGRPEMQAEGKLKISGFRPGMNDITWTLTKVEHTITSSGFVTSIEAEISQ